MKLGIPLGLCMGWLWMLFLNGPLLHNYSTNWVIPPGTVFRLFLLVHSLSFLLISFGGKRIYHWFTLPSFLLTAGGLTAFGTLIAAFISQESAHNLPLLTVGIFSAGVGASILIVACGGIFSRLPIRIAALAFSIAVLIGTLFSYLVNLLPLFFITIIVAVAPVIAALLLLVFRVERQSAESSSHSRFPTRLKLLLAIFYTAGGLMHKIIDYYTPSPVLESYWLTNGIYCLVCLVSGVFIYKIHSIDLRLIYRPVLPLLISGFILFPLLSANHNALLPFVFLQTGFALFDNYTWLLFVYLASFHNVPQAVIGQGMFFTTFFIFIGELLFNDFLPTVMFPEIQMHTVAFSAAIVLSLATLIFRDERESFSGWDNKQHKNPPFVLPEGTEIAGCNEPSNFNTISDFTETPQDLTHHSTPSKAITDSLLIHLLTSREQEIFQFLIKGRNNPYIVERLNISASTLKTHLRNIYRKYNVSNRQELLDKLDQ